METLITRKDKDVGVGAYDSIKWAFEVILKEPDNKKYKSAILFGHHEDSPDRIDFYTVAVPLVTSKVAMTWTPDKGSVPKSKAAYSVSTKGPKSKKGRRPGAAGIGGVR